MLKAVNLMIYHSLCSILFSSSLSLELYGDQNNPVFDPYDVLLYLISQRLYNPRLLSSVRTWLSIGNFI